MYIRFDLRYKNENIEPKPKCCADDYRISLSLAAKSKIYSDN